MAPENPFPENELPKWVMRQAISRGRGAWVAMHAPPYRHLAQFSHDFKLCVRSSADVARGLELCIKPLRSTPLGDRWAHAAEEVRGGATLTEALRRGEDRLPPFYLPVIHAGEESGRLDEALEFLQTHCQQLSGPALALRNVWLFPLVILLSGSLIRVGLHLFMDSVTGAFSLLASELFSWLKLVVLVAIVMLTPARYFVDQVRLSLPFLGELEREIALCRFFRVLALVYSVGGHRVEQMIRTAAKTVSNRAARIELLKAAKAIEQNASIPEAFGHVRLLTDQEQTSIEVGELSGSLEIAFVQISDDTGASMIAKLNLLQPLLVRIVTALVVFSIIVTLAGLASLRA